VAEGVEGDVVGLPENDSSSDTTSIELEVEPQTPGAEPARAETLFAVQTEDGFAIRLEANETRLRFILTDDTGRESDISYSIDNWRSGETFRVVATYGEGETSLYVNGQRVGSASYAGQFEIPEGTPLYLGSDGSDAPSARIKARVYNRALDSDEIW